MSRGSAATSLIRASAPKTSSFELEGLVIDEGRRHGMQGASRGRKDFCRRDLASGRLHRQRQARSDAAAFDMYGAGTTLSVVAAFLGARQTEPFAQHVEERRARIERERMVRPIYSELHGNFRSGATAAGSL